jgi:chromatin segregation and condensation protein Rec8/ScpA/Scc1 (kleisin family)
VEIASHSPPWVNRKDWGPSSDIDYQSFWLTLTAATWRILAIRQNERNRQVSRKDLMEALQDYLQNQYEEFSRNSEIPSESTLYRIVDPVLQQVASRTDSYSLFTGLSQTYVKSEIARKTKSKTSSKSTQ